MKCEECEKEIMSFEYYETVCQRGTFDGKNYSELTINYTYDVEYCCPYCGIKIFNNEEEASFSILRGRK